MKTLLKNISLPLKNFCISNREGILEKDINKISDTTISYSDKVFINIPHLIRQSTKDNQVAIWNHLIHISAIVDPAGKAKDILKKEQEDTPPQNTNFLSDMINTIESNIDHSAPPTEAVGKIMQSGVLNNLIGDMTQGMENGSLDLGQMMGSIQNMVGSLSDNNDVPPEIQQMTSSLTQMVESAGKMTSRQ